MGEPTLTHIPSNVRLNFQSQARLSRQHATSKTGKGGAREFVEKASSPEKKSKKTK
jgi:hypothetical protein